MQTMGVEWLGVLEMSTALLPCRQESKVEKEDGPE